MSCMNHKLHSFSNHEFTIALNDDEPSFSYIISSLNIGSFRQQIINYIRIIPVTGNDKRGVSKL